MEGVGQIVSVPIITGLVYILMLLYKNLVNGREPYIRIIPTLAIVLGLFFGALVFYVSPEIMPATNVFMALLIGACSGLAATGAHQVFKQLGKLDQDVTSSEDLDATNGVDENNDENGESEDANKGTKNI